MRLGRMQYAASVDEDARVGTTVLTVRIAETDAATHDDDGNEFLRLGSRASNVSHWNSNRDVVYSLALDADVEGRFTVDRKSGEIRIARSVLGH